MGLAFVFVFLSSVVLTFAPAIRLRSWTAEYRWEHWVGFATWAIGYTLLLRQVGKMLPERDPYLLPLIALLNGWGLLMIYRLSTSFGFRQTIWLALAILGMLLALKINVKLLATLRRYKYVWLAAGLLLTFLTFFFGTYPGGEGPALWLNLGRINIQPSELLKLLLIVYLAAYLADNFQARLRFSQLLAPTVILILAAVMVLIAQRDLGTATLFIILYTIVMYLATGKRRILLFSFLFLTVALIAGYLLFDVIQLRVEAWINPWLDPRNRSYQIIQSLIAVANGGLFGRGLGLGNPGVVPVAHSDFIFTALLEEYGVAGGMILVGVYSLFTIRGLTIALRAPNQFQRFLAAGLTTYLATQSILIMGGTLRLFPLTGVTLPFISYGGTSLVVSMAALLLLLIISNHIDENSAAIERTAPYKLIGSVFLGCFTAIALLSVYWGFVRADSLLARSDNPRRAISDVYVHRGDILDRNNNPLATNNGSAGSYERVLLYPPLSSVIGYSNPNYGQTGIESHLDGILRGITNNSEFTVMSTRLLYGQDPVGYDLRLSLDLPLQQTADQLLAESVGAIVAINSSTGEIVIMASSPTFDANQLEANWETWRVDESAPLLNRATQALYPPGTITSGNILARYLSEKHLPGSLPDIIWNTLPGSAGFCALQPTSNADWGQLFSSGCFKAVSLVSRSTTIREIIDLYESTGLFDSGSLPLESAEAIIPQTIEKNDDIFSGASGILVSPLQVAISLTPLSNEGRLATPQIATAYSPAIDQWNLIDQGSNPSTIPNFDAESAATLLISGDFPGWEIASHAFYQDADISWYAAGTPSDWHGSPITIVVALENSSPSIARSIGRELFFTATDSLESK